MIRRLSLLVGIVVILISSLGAAAQPATPWQAAILAFDTVDGQPWSPAASAQIIRLDASGVTSTTPIDPSWLAGGSRVITNWAVDPTLARAALVVGQASQESSADVVFIDLATGVTLTLQPPGPDVPTYNTLTFSPDGTQIAAAFISFISRADFQIAGGLVIWDTATGAIAQIKPIADLLTAAGQPGDQFGWPYLGAWTAEGIEWHPNCYACEGVFAGQWSLWNPATDAVTVETGRYFNDFFADRLAATGEQIVGEFSTSYPNPGIMGMLPDPNVVAYYADGVLNDPFFDNAAAPVIFFDPGAYPLGRPRWVADGAAVAVRGAAGELHVIFRDGERLIYADPTAGGVDLLFGTPAGFVAVVNGADGPVLQAYTIATTPGARAVISAGWTNTASLMQSAPVVRTLRAPALGASLTAPTAFPLIAPPSPEQAATQAVQVGRSCVGQPASRLSAGALGMVTPGTPNRLRAEPTTVAAVVGEIPAGMVFSVYSGPYCDPANNLVWWEVEYNGVRGFTVEIVDGQYVVEPMGI